MYCIMTKWDEYYFISVEINFIAFKVECFGKLKNHDKQLANRTDSCYSKNIELL